MCRAAVAGDVSHVHTKKKTCKRSNKKTVLRNNILVTVFFVTTFSRPSPSPRGWTTIALSPPAVAKGALWDALRCCCCSWRRCALPPPTRSARPSRRRATAPSAAPTCALAFPRPTITCTTSIGRRGHELVCWGQGGGLPWVGLPHPCSAPTGPTTASRSARLRQDHLQPGPERYGAAAARESPQADTPVSRRTPASPPSVRRRGAMAGAGSSSGAQQRRTPRASRPPVHTPHPSSPGLRWPSRRDVGGNSLSGTVPPELEGLTELTTL